MLLQIKDDSDSPIYRQIVDQIKAQVADGTIIKGERLPSVRELAKDLKINVNTIYKSYKELEIQGVIRMKVGLGVTVISERQDRLKRSDKEKILRELLDNIRVEAYHLGFDDNYLIDQLRHTSKE